MATKAGINLLLKVESPASSGTYATLGGLQAKKMTINAEVIDVTNHGSQEWKELLSAHGVRDVKISGNGVFDNASGNLSVVEDACLNNSLINFQVVDADSGRTYTGSFKVVTWERNGEHKGAQIYAVTLESSGAVVVS